MNTLPDRLFSTHAIIFLFLFLACHTAQAGRDCSAGTGEELDGFKAGERVIILGEKLVLGKIKSFSKDCKVTLDEVFLNGNSYGYRFVESKQLKKFSLLPGPLLVKVPLQEKKSVKQVIAQALSRTPDPTRDIVYSIGDDVLVNRSSPGRIYGFVDDRVVAVTRFLRNGSVDELQLDFVDVGQLEYVKPTHMPLVNSAMQSLQVGQDVLHIGKDRNGRYCDHFKIGNTLPDLRRVGLTPWNRANQTADPVGLTQSYFYVSPDTLERYEPKPSSKIKAGIIRPGDFVQVDNSFTWLKVIAVLGTEFVEIESSIGDWIDCSRADRIKAIKAH